MQTIVLVPLLALTVAARAQIQMQQIELDPPAVGSSSNSHFTVLPTANPTLFGLTGADVRRVNFDVDLANVPIPHNTTLTNQFAPIGVLMNGVRVSTSVYGGPASPPNATLFDQGHVFTFTVPVVAAGVINTSPDHDRVELWSGPNGTGTLLLSFTDLQGQPINYNVDRFVGGRAVAGATIGSMTVRNASGNLELDELIFEVCDDVVPVTLGSGCAGSGGLVPALAVSGCEHGGGTIALQLENALGGSVGVIVGGFGRTSLPLHSSCTLFVGQPALLALLPLSGTGPGTGTALFSQPIPLGLPGLAVGFQGAVLDPAVAAGFVVTAGQEITVR